MSGPQGNNPFHTITKSDESIAVTAAYQTLFTIDLDGYGDAVLNLRNTDAVLQLQYKIFASPKEVDILPADSDDSWTNIIDTNTDPQSYDNTASRTIPTQTTFYESLSNKFRWFRIEMRESTEVGTLTAKVWLRGRNAK